MTKQRGERLDEGKARQGMGKKGSWRARLDETERGGVKEREGMIGKARGEEQQ